MGFFSQQQEQRQPQQPTTPRMSFENLFRAVREVMDVSSFAGLSVADRDALAKTSGHDRTVIAMVEDRLRCSLMAVAEVSALYAAGDLNVLDCSRLDSVFHAVMLRNGLDTSVADGLTSLTHAIEARP